MGTITAFLARRALPGTMALFVAACGGGSSGGSSGRSAPAYAVSGVLTGLAAGQIVVAIGLDRKPISTQDDGVIRDIPFTFSVALPEGADFNLVVVEKDDNVTCEVQRGSGTMAAAPVTDVLIQCFATPSLRLLAGRLPRPDIDGIATAIGFTANSLAVARDGTIYLAADSALGVGLPVLRRITPSGFITTYVGGTPGIAVDGSGPGARLTRPRALTFAPDNSGDLLFVDESALRRVSPEGTVTTIAGSLTDARHLDATAPLSARFNGLNGLVVLADGTILLTEAERVGGRASRLRRIAPNGEVSTLAQVMDSLDRDRFNTIVLGLDGTPYVGRGSEFFGSRVVDRVILDASGGVAFEPLNPGSLPFFRGIQVLTPETPSSLVAFTQSSESLQMGRVFVDGVSPAMELSNTGAGGTRGRKCMDGTLASAQLEPEAVSSFAPGQFLVAETQAYGTVARLVGEPTNATGLSMLAADFVDGPAETATFAAPSALVASGGGRSYLLDHRQGAPTASLRRIESDGRVTTIREDVPYSAAAFLYERNFMQYMAIDPSDTSSPAFVVAASNSVWRFQETGAETLLAGGGTFLEPGGVAVARSGTVYVADTGNKAIRAIQPGSSSVSTISSGDEIWSRPVAVALSADDQYLLVLDIEDDVVRAIHIASGTVRTVVGTQGVNRLTLGTLPASLAPTSEFRSGFRTGGGWEAHALLVRGNKLYIALGDVVLEANLALR